MPQREHPCVAGCTECVLMSCPGPLRRSQAALSSGWDAYGVVIQRPALTKPFPSMNLLVAIFPPDGCLPLGASATVQQDAHNLWVHRQVTEV